MTPFVVTTGSAADVEKRCTSRIGKEMPTAFREHPVTELSPGYITRSRCDGRNRLSLDDMNFGPPRLPGTNSDQQSATGTANQQCSVLTRGAAKRVAASCSQSQAMW